MCVSASSSVRRARSSRGTLAGAAAWLIGFAAAFGVGFLAVRGAAFLPVAAVLPFGSAFLLAFVAGAFFLADACRFTGRFALGRLAERPEVALPFVDFVDLARLTPCRLAMAESFRNLDSLAISVVLSVAYRNSEKPSGGRHPLHQPPEISDRTFDRIQEDAQGMANAADENTPGAGGVATTERPERGERTDKGTLKILPREDDEIGRAHV